MRQKRLKFVNLQLMKDLGVLTEPKLINTNNKEVHLEIGSGKGQFITSLAKDNPNKLFIAVEKNINVCYRIVEKRNQLELDNLIIILDDSNNLLNYLNPQTVNKIYLNFSDPWPKAKHHKRRLTYEPFLQLYKKLLVKEGIISLRTDHYNFFIDSIDYLEKYFYIYDIDLDYQSNEYQTEYEQKKRKIGKIYQCIARLKNNENL